jgi:hypothetical protein
MLNLSVPFTFLLQTIAWFDSSHASELYNVSQIIFFLKEEGNYCNHVIGTLQICLFSETNRASPSCHYFCYFAWKWYFHMKNVPLCIFSGRHNILHILKGASMCLYCACIIVFTVICCSAFQCIKSIIFI